MSKIRVGIIGAGGRGVMSFARMFSNEYKEQAEVVAFGEPNRERAEAGMAYIGIRADIHEDIHDVFTRKDIDAVVITTPDYLHEEHCVMAFKHGKHVLVDKPLAITGKGCLRVVEASKKSGKLLYMGFNMRHDCVVRKLKQMIDAGTFGEVFSLQAIEHYNGGRTYMSRWNRLKKFSGSLWIHKGSHDFDVINWLMGAARPVKVSCFANVFVLKEAGLPFKPKKGVKPGPTCSACAYKATCPDQYTPANAVANLPDTERLSYIRMWGDESARFDGYHKDLCVYLSDKDTHDQGIAIVEYDTGATASHSEYFATPLNNRRYMIEATKGRADADLHNNTIDFQPRWSQDNIHHQIYRDPGGHGGADPVMCAEFIRCIQQGERPTASGIDGAWSVAIGEAAELARTKGRVVKISEVLDVKSSLLKV